MPRFSSSRARIGAAKRAQLRASRSIASRVKGGTIYIGHLERQSASPTLTIDSLAIRDKRGELLASTGRITLAYNPRDLIDSRIYITRASIEHPYVHLIQHENGVWNFKEIFASTSTQPTKPKDPNDAEPRRLHRHRLDVHARTRRSI